MYVNPYVNFNGDCATAFRFYEECLGGTVEAMITFGETEGGDQMPPDMKDLVMHARMKVGDSVLMGSDAPQPRYTKPQGAYISLQVDDPAEAERIFHALEEGGTVEMPIQQTFWAERFGMLVDRFGIPWMINCEAKQG